MDMNELYENAIQQEARFCKIKIMEIRYSQKRYTYYNSTNAIKIPNLKSDVDFMFSLFVLGMLAVPKIPKIKPQYAHIHKVMKWVMERMQYHKVEITDGVLKQIKERVMYAVMKSHNRKGDVAKIPSEIREFLFDLEPDFTTWRGNNVYFTTGMKIVKSPDERLQEAEKQRKATKRKRITDSFLKEKDV
jgi:hypothetical protein